MGEGKLIPKPGGKSSWWMYTTVLRILNNRSRLKQDRGFPKENKGRNHQKVDSRMQREHKRQEKNELFSTGQRKKDMLPAIGARF